MKCIVQSNSILLRGLFSCVHLCKREQRERAEVKGRDSLYNEMEMHCHGFVVVP